MLVFWEKGVSHLFCDVVKAKAKLFRRFSTEKEMMAKSFSSQLRSKCLKIFLMSDLSLCKFLRK